MATKRGLTSGEGSSTGIGTGLGTASTSTARISIINGEAYVWDADDIADLRRNYGIIGLLSGSLPLIPQQNAFLGVPLQLLEEEVTYLLRSHAAIVVDDVAAHDVDGLDDETRQQWHAARAEHIAASKREAAQAAEENRRKWQGQAQSGKAEDRRRAREAQRAQQRAAGGGLFGQDDGDDGWIEAGEGKKAVSGTSHRTAAAAAVSNVDATAGASSEAPSSQTPPPDISHPVLIPASSAQLPWHNLRLGENAFDSLSSAARAGLWTYPQTAEQRARCAAFEALRAKGYYMGKGLRFGGHLVVYPGT